MKQSFRDILMLILLIGIQATFAQATTEPENKANVKGSFTDSRDGKKYKTVVIGTQNWMAENLNYAAEGSKCYGNRPTNCQKYGRLYNWNTAMTACPSGWHLPSNADWDALMSSVDGYTTKAGKFLKAKSGWNKGNGQDTYGFSALPGGSGSSDGSFSTIGYFGDWWSSSEYNANSAYFWYMYYNEDADYNYNGVKGFLYSIRCLQDLEQISTLPIASITPTQPISDSEGSATPTVSIFKDSRDNKTYKTVTIGTQNWMAENLNYAAEGSKCYGNRPTNCQKYGRLYNWNTAMTACPSGWHLPSDAEWNVLMKFVDQSCSDNSICVGAGTKLKATSDWNQNGNGTDAYGFSALPGGAGLLGGDFRKVDYSGLWWSSSEYSNRSAYLRGMSYISKNVFYDYGVKLNLFNSVRCLQDLEQTSVFPMDPINPTQSISDSVGSATPTFSGGTPGKIGNALGNLMSEQMKKERRR